MFRHSVSARPRSPGAVHRRDGAGRSSSTGNSTGRTTPCSGSTATTPWFSATALPAGGAHPVYAVGGSTNPDDWGEVPATTTSLERRRRRLAAGRLPAATEMEWLWAAMAANTGGDPAAVNRPAGSCPSPADRGNLIGTCVWYTDNSSSTTHPAGARIPTPSACTISPATSGSGATTGWAAGPPARSWTGGVRTPGPRAWSGAGPGASPLPPAPSPSGRASTPTIPVSTSVSGWCGGSNGRLPAVRQGAADGYSPSMRVWGCMVCRTGRMHGDFVSRGDAECAGVFRQGFPKALPQPLRLQNQFSQSPRENLLLRCPYNKFVFFGAGGILMEETAGTGRFLTNGQGCPHVRACNWCRFETCTTIVRTHRAFLPEYFLDSLFRADGRLYCCIVTMSEMWSAKKKGYTTMRKIVLLLLLPLLLAAAVS